MNMKLTPIPFNEELRKQIKDAIAALTDNPKTQDPRILLTIECINQMSVYDRNLMFAYMFICDYSTLELSKLFGASRQAIKGHIMELNKQIQSYVKSHYQPNLSDTDNLFCD
jgi:hypothetical protein